MFWHRQLSEGDMHMNSKWHRLGRFCVACLLAGPMTACNESTPISPSSAQPDDYLIKLSESLPCTSLDTVNKLMGVVSERTPDGIQPVGDATVNLVRVIDIGGFAEFHILKGILTAADGSYFMCVPPPLEGSGATEADGQAFQMRVGKAGTERSLTTSGTGTTFGVTTSSRSTWSLTAIDTRTSSL